MHHGGDGGVQHEGDKEEEPEHADDGEGAEEQGGVVLDLLHAGRRLLRLPHGGVHLRHGEAPAQLPSQSLFTGKQLTPMFGAALCLYSGLWDSA